MKILSLSEHMPHMELEGSTPHVYRTGEYSTLG